MKIEKGLVDRLTDLTNRSRGQTQFLFELCDFDFDKLLLLETKIKNNHVFYCPGDKETVDEILKLGDGKKRFKLTWLMCKPMCRFKEIPELTGLISKELQKNHCQYCIHTKFEEQWGVNWEDKSLTTWIQNKGGLPNFWQDKTSLEVVLIEDDNKEKLWGYDPVEERRKEEEERLLKEFTKKSKKKK